MVDNFPKGINPKVNVIAKLQFKLRTMLHSNTLSASPQGFSHDRLKEREREREREREGWGWGCIYHVGILEKRKLSLILTGLVYRQLCELHKIFLYLQFFCYFFLFFSANRLS